MTAFRNKINPVQTGLFLLPATGGSSGGGGGGGGGGPPAPPPPPPSFPLHNLKIAYPSATKIIHNTVLVISDFWA